MPFDRPPGQEQLRADLRVGPAVTGQLRTELGTAQPVDRFAVQVVGSGVRAEQCPAARLDAERGIVAAELRNLRQLLER
jgi:hypothetical protein